MENTLLKGPLSVAVGTGNTWFNYKTGIVNGSSGCPTRLDHAVIIVG